MPKPTLCNNIIHKPMGIETLPYRAGNFEFARFEQAADKTLTQRLLYVSPPARNPVNGPRTFDGAKIQIFLMCVREKVYFCRRFNES